MGWGGGGAAGAEVFPHFLRAFFFVKINSWEWELVGQCLRKSYCDV